MLEADYRGWGCGVGWSVAVAPGRRRSIAFGGVNSGLAENMSVLDNLLSPGFDIVMPKAARVVGKRFVIQYAG